MLTALPLAMIVLLAAFSVLSLMMNGFDRLFQEADQQFYARMLLEQISKDVKESSSIEVVNGGKGLSLVDENGRSIRYYTNCGQAIRSVGGSSIPITENTNELVFSELGNGTIKVDVIFKQERTGLIISSICTCRH